MIRTIARCLTVAGLLVAGGQAIAADKPVGRLTRMPASKLLGLCQSPHGAAPCDAYISGIADGITLVESAAGPDVARKVCIPAVSGNQMRSAVVAWMSKHNDRLSADVGPVVFDALADTFPCGGSDGGKEGASKP